MATALPPGVNLEDNRGPEIIRAVSVVAVLATLALVARLAARRLKKTRLGASDYAVILGWLMAWGFNIVMYISVRVGLGRHVEVLSTRKHVELKIFFFAEEILYTITLVAVKISILLLYRSIFFVSRAFAIVVNVTNAFVVAGALALILVSIFTCKPIYANWDIKVPSTCINSSLFYISASTANICMDVFILSLPVRDVWQLQMPLRQKFLVLGLFLLGGFVCISSGIRLYMLLSINVNDHADSSWTYCGIFIWSAVEINTAVISACLPTIRPVLQLGVTVFHKLLSSSKSSWSPALDATSSNVLERKEGNVFHRVPDSSQGSNVPSKPAKGKHVNTIYLQVNLEGGDLAVKDGVM